MHSRVPYPTARVSTSDRGEDTRLAVAAVPGPRLLDSTGATVLNNGPIPGRPRRKIRILHRATGMPFVIVADTAIVAL